MPREIEVPTEWIQLTKEVRIAANIRPSDEVHFREGQNFFDQYPLSWLFAFVPIEDVDFLSNKASLEEIIASFIAAACYFRYSMPHLSSVSSLKYQSEIVRGNCRRTLRSVFKDRLQPDFNLTKIENMYRLITVIRRFHQEIDSYPYLFDYLKEFWYAHQGSFNGVFDFMGEPKPDKLGGSYTIPSYAAYARRKLLNQQNMRWVGMAEVLPDATALLPEQARALGESLAQQGLFIMQVVKALGEGEDGGGD